MISVATYKSAGSEDDAKLQEILVDSMGVYLKHAKALPMLSEEEKASKLEITVEYTNGLVEKGGISTDVFKKELGEEETKNFFAKVFFGTAAE